MPGGMMHGRRREPMGTEEAERMGRMFGLIRHLEQACFNPKTAGLLAVGGLKDDVTRDDAATIGDLEQQLEKTHSLGMRNAIRLTLKDLYKAEGNEEKVLSHLRAMLEENDKALVERAEKWRQKGDDDDDDDDDDDE